MRDSMPMRGGCLCGGVRFEVDPPTRWCAHCHCHLCRGAHGAAFVTWFGVPLGQFRITAGEELLQWYASTAEAKRGFCSRCGATMLFQSSRWADEMHVTLAHMEGPLDRQPTAHVYYDRHVDWVELGDDLKRRGGETGVEPLAAD